MVTRAQFLQGVPRLAAEGRDALAANGWLARMPSDFREALLHVAIWRVATPGTEFIHAGDSQGGLFGIARGTVEISFMDGHPDARFIHLAHVGFWAGGRPLLGHRRNLCAVAQTEVLWALAPQLAMARLLGEQPGWWRHIAQLTDIGYMVASGALADLSLQDSRHRLIAVLLRLCGCRYADPPGEHPLILRVSQLDLAAAAVMSRNSTNAFLAALADEGLIEVQYRAILICNSARLRAVLEED